MPTLFNDRVYETGRGVPVHQVQEFKPHITLGCSLSSPAFLALWMSGRSENIYNKLLNWPNYAIYYASIISNSKGTIRNLPALDEPLVRFSLSQKDMTLLGEGLYRLGKLLFEVGAEELLSPVQGFPLIKKPADLKVFKKALPHAITNITTIHLFSSCPMGEALRFCATDSFGKVHGYNNIYINDASMLPSPPGVNPQGTIMALARRNIIKFLEGPFS
jgi:choline dehydrogenase-like flavoprotein